MIYDYKQSLPPKNITFTEDKNLDRANEENALPVDTTKIENIVVKFKETLSPFYYNAFNGDFLSHIEKPNILCTGRVVDGNFEFSKFQTNSTQEAPQKPSSCDFVIYRTFNLVSENKTDEGFGKYYVPLKSLSLEVKSQKLTSNDQFILNQAIETINELIKVRLLDLKS